MYLSGMVITSLKTYRDLGLSEQLRCIAECSK